MSYSLDLFFKPAQGETAMPSFDQTPDVPEAFGYKVSWFAVKAADPASVLDALEFGDVTPANWASGLAASYTDIKSSERWVFASPPIGGWVFVVGSSLPYPTVEAHQEIGAQFDLLFSRLMRRFDDVQFFGSYRVVGFVAWARALNGEPTRLFAFADADVLANVGAQTLEEAKLGFVDLSGLSPSDARDKLSAVSDEQMEEEERLIASGLSYAEARAKVQEKGRDALPDEEDVIDLAALWSLDPRQLQERDQHHPVGLGLAARLPKDFAR